MYDFTFENKGANSYLVYKFKPDDRIDTMTLGMITNNKIQHINILEGTHYLHDSQYENMTKIINTNLYNKK